MAHKCDISYLFFWEEHFKIKITTIGLIVQNFEKKFNNNFLFTVLPHLHFLGENAEIVKKNPKNRKNNLECENIMPILLEKQ